MNLEDTLSWFSARAAACNGLTRIYPGFFPGAFSILCSNQVTARVPAVSAICGPASNGVIAGELRKIERYPRTRDVRTEAQED